MDMSMDGMHGDHPGMGSEINHAFSRDYWYIAAGVVGFLATVRAVNAYGAHVRISSCRNPAIQHPTRPNGRLSQAWATATAFVREMSHPQYYIPIKSLRWATPLPLGRILALLAYWAVIVYFMSWRVVANDATYWERIGFRNAWVTVCQLPMLYLLAMKYNPIGLLIDTSHERINWLHRWVGRTMFITATCHGFHFWTEWVRADFVEYELEIMPMVKYGLGAWAILLWSVVVGFVPIRRLAYEIWLLQHIASAAVMLWLIYKHIPANARHFLWMAIAFLAFDRLARWANLLWQNVQFRRNKSVCEGRSRIGHRVFARAVGDATTVLTIKDVHFKWSAGQHIYLWVPRLGPLEAHPYTIACAHRLEGACCCNSIQLIVRAHGGFSKRLHKYAVENPAAELTGLVSGPYGAPANWDTFERLVLIGASTGASFVVPILEAVATKSQEKTCVRRIDLAVVAKSATETQYYMARAKDAAQAARAHGIAVHLHLAITGGHASASRPTSGSLLQGEPRDSSELDLDEKRAAAHQDTHVHAATRSSRSNSDAQHATHVVKEYAARPDIEALIREPVEDAWGETAVVVCGGKEIVARTRNCVAALSDERAVHKGTGAQGIYLHVEEYAF
ncbi:FAD-binding 8 [Cordyceps fumosorosea ARSEF 2679]|uniref:ferric-chelate reductase (NADPH) n=1 Tax=Cordyceps fumosorosea (strain ARSEF 2679) TaxID=1081104 RepID=A0A167LYU9_CORFA|nr:FAD-binding 8 [Cordyceps fumosorosea ARSEF 2679]OAA53702.1 FAD-binding 8 [Cordyceps fumosorosea ARSEF 2679]